MKRRFLAAILAAAVGLIVTARGADEITANAAFSMRDGYLNVTRSGASTWTVTNPLPAIASDSHIVTTGAWTTVTTGSILRPGWAWFRNLSTNNTVAMGLLIQDTAQTNYFETLRLKAGEYWLGRLGTNTLYLWFPSDAPASTNEASSIVDKVIVDD